MVKTKFVTIESYGQIDALGGIRGPITSPSHIDTNIVISLINSGKVVYEVNPSNYKEKVRLNRLNVLKNNFSNSTKQDSTKSISNVSKQTGTKLPQTKIPVASTVNSNIIHGNNNNSIGIDFFVSNKRS